MRGLTEDEYVSKMERGIWLNAEIKRMGEKGYGTNEIAGHKGNTIDESGRGVHVGEGENCTVTPRIENV